MSARPKIVFLVTEFMTKLICSELLVCTEIEGCSGYLISYCEAQKTKIWDPRVDNKIYENIFQLQAVKYD
jgi:hypothetical protein